MQDQAQLRRECEARAWLRAGYANAAKLVELKTLLRKHRSEAAVDMVIEEMRRQWVRREEWMGD